MLTSAGHETRGAIVRFRRRGKSQIFTREDGKIDDAGRNIFRFIFFLHLTHLDKEFGGKRNVESNLETPN